MNQDTTAAPTVVFVHGAFADASGWAGVITELTADGITVLDLGSVRRVEDRWSDVWTTTGFVAPEIHPGGPGPSVASEVFALGRTLAVLLADFDHQRRHAHRLPDPAGVPVLRDDPDLMAGYRSLAPGPAIDTGARVRLALYRVYLALVMRVEAVPRAYGGEFAAWLDTWSAERVTRQLATLNALEA